MNCNVCFFGTAKERISICFSCCQNPEARRMCAGEPSCLMISGDLTEGAPWLWLNCCMRMSTVQ